MREKSCNNLNLKKKKKNHTLSGSIVNLETLSSW